ALPIREIRVYHERTQAKACGYSLIPVNDSTLVLGNVSLLRVKRLAREFLWVGIGQAAAALGGLAGVSLLTRALTPERYGELALGMTVATLTQQSLLGPVAGALLRFFAPATEAGQLNAY